MSKHAQEPNEGKLMRVLDDEWSEYCSPAGRKFYKNEITREISWKPPRKSKPKRNSSKENQQPIKITPPTRASTWSLPANPNENVGGILRKGLLKISKAFGEELTKKKWHKCVAYLTNTHFVYIRKKRLDDQAGKIALTAAAVRLRFGKKKQYLLTSMKDGIYFKSKKNLEAEAWYHATAAVIHSLSRPKNQRPRSCIEWGSLATSQCDASIFISDFDSLQRNGVSEEKFSAFESRILSEILWKNSTTANEGKSRGIRSFFGKSVDKSSKTGIESQYGELLSNLRQQASKESLISLPIIEEDEELFDDRVNKFESRRTSKFPNEPESISQSVLKAFMGKKGDGGGKTDIKHSEPEKKRKFEDRKDSVRNNKENITTEINSETKITPKSKEMPIGVTEIDRQNFQPEMNEPNTRWRPEIDPGDVIKNENNFPLQFKQPVFGGNIKYPTPPGWVAIFDLKRRQYFYENTWSADVWTAAKSENGIMFFYDIKSHRTSWLLPSEKHARTLCGLETCV